MNQKNKISSFFEKKNIRLIGEITENYDDNEYIAFVSISLDGKGKQVPTKNMLTIIGNAFDNLKIIPIFGYNRDIASYIRSVISEKYNDIISSIHVQIEEINVSILIEYNNIENISTHSDIKKYSKKLINNLKLNLLYFENLSEYNFPTKILCLRIIRKKSPIRKSELELELRERELDFPTSDWLSKKLDLWRKENLIYRKSDNTYVMTLQGLKILGSDKSRLSPDVFRALDMGQRRG